MQKAYVLIIFLYESVILREGERALSDKSQQKEVKGWRKD